jgi:hypothetical protein
MNEHIKYLAEQAGEYASTTGSNHKERAEWQELFEGKFAELIVKECANLATIEYDKRGAINGVDLLEHFGVKE